MSTGHSPIASFAFAIVKQVCAPPQACYYTQVYCNALRVYHSWIDRIGLTSLKQNSPSLSFALYSGTPMVVAIPWEC